MLRDYNEYPHRLGWFLAASFCSALMWYMITMLALTGHSQILWGAKKTVNAVNYAGGRVRHEVHVILGDQDYSHRYGEIVP